MKKICILLAILCLSIMISCDLFSDDTKASNSDEIVYIDWSNSQSSKGITTGEFFNTNRNDPFMTMYSDETINKYAPILHMSPTDLEGDVVPGFVGGVYMSTPLCFPD